MKKGKQLLLLLLLLLRSEGLIYVKIERREEKTKALHSRRFWALWLVSQMGLVREVIALISLARQNSNLSEDSTWQSHHWTCYVRIRSFKLNDYGDYLHV